LRKPMMLCDKLATCLLPETLVLRLEILVRLRVTLVDLRQEILDQGQETSVM